MSRPLGTGILGREANGREANERPREANGREGSKPGSESDLAAVFRSDLETWRTHGKHMNYPVPKGDYNQLPTLSYANRN